MTGNEESRELSHVAPDGSARMVDVSAKADTNRMARATGSIRMSQADAPVAHALPSATT